ncbi:MAG: response regulator [bacterium]|nr:response regulator [bacterium]
MEDNQRILVVDDDPGVRDAFKEILAAPPTSNIAERGAALFGEEAAGPPSPPPQTYDLCLTENGGEGVRAVKQSLEQQLPFAVAFIDMNMPGIDGAETSRRIWALDPQIKIVIVTAFSEYRPCDIIKIVRRDDIFYLRKPFNSEEIRQFANALTHAWDTEREREILAARLETVNAELEDMNKNLQQKVKEQTALLIQSEKMSSLGVLAAGVAHEINNPISFVHGNLDAIRKYSASIKQLLLKYQALEESALRHARDDMQPLIEEIAEFKGGHKIDFILEDIVSLADESLDGTRRVRDIVRELRGFSHVDDATPPATDVNEAIEKALNIIDGELNPQTQIVKAYGELPSITGYPQKLGQVFINIVMNAVQAVADNGVINIATGHLMPAGEGEPSKVEICISDNGHGIPGSELPKVFDPFFTTKPVGKGTGLGLSISYDIVNSHGGEIMIESTENEGTSVRVILPVDAAAKGSP